MAADHFAGGTRGCEVDVDADAGFGIGQGLYVSLCADEFKVFVYGGALELRGAVFVTAEVRRLSWRRLPMQDVMAASRMPLARANCSRPATRDSSGPKRRYAMRVVSIFQD